MEDYIDFVLGRNQPKAEGGEKAPKKSKAAVARSREEEKRVRKEVSEAEKAIAKLQARLSAVDLAMADPGAASSDLAKLTMGELGQRRAAITRELDEAEQAWLAATERLEEQAS
jgi:ATP-binding cassette subfamily F protein 3